MVAGRCEKTVAALMVSTDVAPDLGREARGKSVWVDSIDLVGRFGLWSAGCPRCLDRVRNDLFDNPIHGRYASVVLTKLRSILLGDPVCGPLGIHVWTGLKTSPGQTRSLGRSMLHAIFAIRLGPRVESHVELSSISSCSACWNELIKSTKKVVVRILSRLLSQIVQFCLSDSQLHFWKLSWLK